MIAIQTNIDNPIPTNIFGNLEYLNESKDLEWINEFIEKSDIEKVVSSFWISEAQETKTELLSLSQTTAIIEKSATALRIAILRKRCDFSLREMAKYLAMSPLYQWFCKINTFGSVKIPAKSTIESYENKIPIALIKKLNENILLAAQSTNDKETSAIGLEAPISIDAVYADCTCQKVAIHFPVDWVLLRDGIRTLMKAVTLIRKCDLKNRMSEEPLVFISKINKLCIQMTQCSRKVDSKKHRKAVLRKMKKLVKIVKKHAVKHRNLLAENIEASSYSEKKAEQILNRIKSILEKLPEAERQAHERIIGERMIPSKNKILSLYEDEVSVLVRKKAGAEVEFGNKLYLCEQADGLIVDWELFGKEIPSEPKMLIKSIGTIREKYGALKLVGTDRGFDSKASRKCLADSEIYNGICRKDPNELIKSLSDDIFKTIQKRRSQTEARISIFRNYSGSPQKQKGLGNRKHHIGLSVMSHNFSVLCKIMRRQLFEKEVQENLLPLAA